MEGAPVADQYSYYTFDDLAERRIVRSRTHLAKLIRTEGFPAPVKFGDSKQSASRWNRSAVHSWLESRVRASTAA